MRDSGRRLRACAAWVATGIVATSLVGASAPPAWDMVRTLASVVSAGAALALLVFLTDPGGTPPPAFHA